MRHFCLTLFLTLVLHSLFLSNCFSQQDTTSQRPNKVILKDGSELIGTIVKEDSASIFFRTVSNISMTIPKSQVKTTERLSGQFTDGQYVRPDPNFTRLFFAPTARPLKSGQGYFSAYQIFFPFLAVGLSDFVTLAGGMSLIPGAESQIIYFAPKITPVQLGDLSVAGGVLYIHATFGESDGVGIIYGVTSFGNQNASLTAGLGWGFSGNETAHKPIILLGGELRASNSIKFITENWIPPDSDIAFLSFGIRFFGDSLASDLGLIYPAGSRFRGFPFFPWLGFAYNFGTAK